MADFVVGQQLPAVADNSQWFPPAGTQYWNSCHVYSMVGYLKSYNWNRKYNRDPKLPQNQFSPYFVWNLNIDPLYHWTESYRTFDFVKNQGCATIDNFSSSGESQEIIPDLITREKALSYKSNNLRVKNLGVHSNEQASSYLKELKDSLNKGVCFTLHFPLFKSIDKLYEPNESVWSYEDNKLADMYFTHLAVVVGYDDNIVTKTGKGALKILNSWGDVFGDNGYFYLDYNFFKISDWNFACYFLEEDFSHKTDLYLNLNLSQTITGEDIYSKKYIFADGIEKFQGQNYDFADLQTYLSGKNLVKIKNINNQNKPELNNIVALDRHNHDGNHKIIFDLTDYVSSSSFQSMQIIVQDPVSSVYKGNNDEVIYSYSRDSKIGISNSLVKFIDSGKTIVGKVTNLPDTTIVINDFYSVVVGANLTPFQEQVYVKSCTSVLKRKLITFSVADLQTNTAPVFTQVPSAISAKKGESVSFNFKATDAENNPIVYSMTSASGASIDAVTGLFQYQTSQAGTPSFTVKASDGIETISTTFTITVTDIVINPLVFTKTPSAPVKVLTNEVYKFQFAASGPEGKTLKFSVDPPVFSFVTVSINETTGEYSFTSPNSCGFEAAVYVSDGTQTVSFRFVVTVNLPLVNNPPAFTQVPNGDLTATAGQLVSFTFKATDPENSPITYSIGGGLGASIDAVTGLFQYQTSQAGTVVYKIDATDGVNIVSTMASIKVVAAVNSSPVFTQIPNGDLTATAGELVSFTFKATDPENSAITYSIVNGTGASIDAVTGLFQYQASQVGSFAFTVSASDGVNAVSTIVNVKVNAVANNAPVFVNLPGTLLAYVNKEFTYQFEATDKEGDNLTFSIQNPLAAGQISSSGKLTFKGTQVMTYRFTVIVSDGKASTSAAVAINVDLVDDVEEVVIPDYSVSIYPNPIAENMNIKVVSKDNTSVKMTIYDMQGRAMSTVINECGVGDNTFNYEASALKSGVYICKFVAGNTVLQTIKIIKK
ncbi:MAG: T9SS type A sorting domain-containing protein [Patescibacteria group bacterium]